MPRREAASVFATVRPKEQTMSANPTEALSRKLACALCACAMLIGWTGASAQATSTGSGHAYPTKPIRMIVPFPAAGATDVLARIFGQKLSEGVRQQVTIDN